MINDWGIVLTTTPSAIWRRGQSRTETLTHAHAIGGGGAYKTGRWWPVLQEPGCRHSDEERCRHSDVVYHVVVRQYTNDVVNDTCSSRRCSSYPAFSFIMFFTTSFLFSRTMFRYTWRWSRVGFITSDFVVGGG